MRPADIELRTSWLLAILIVILAGILAEEWRHAQSPAWKAQARFESKASQAMPKLLPDFSLPPFDPAYRETLLRPIFFSSRQSALTDKTGASQMRKGQFMLMGVVLTQGEKIAMLKDVASGKAERVQEGQEIRGMMVEQVSGQKVVLKQGGESEELLLKVQPSSPPGKNLPPIDGKPLPVASVTVVEAPRRLDTEAERAAERERRYQQEVKFEAFQAANRERVKKGLPELPVPPDLVPRRGMF